MSKFVCKAALLGLLLVAGVGTAMATPITYDVNVVLDSRYKTNAWQADVGWVTGTISLELLPGSYYVSFDLYTGSSGTCFATDCEPSTLSPSASYHPYVPTKHWTNQVALSDPAYAYVHVGLNNRRLTFQNKTNYPNEYLIMTFTQDMFTATGGLTFSSIGEYLTANTYSVYNQRLGGSGGTATVHTVTTASVPEPPVVPMLLSGLIGVGACRCRQRGRS